MTRVLKQQPYTSIQQYLKILHIIQNDKNVGDSENVLY